MSFRVQWGRRTIVPALLLIAALLPTSLAANSPPVIHDCDTDRECGAGQVCEGYSGGDSRCISEDRVCVYSTQCTSEQVCSHHQSSCPPVGERCANLEWGYCLQLPPLPCEADSACAEDSLCVVRSTPLCLPDDLICLRAGRTGCSQWSMLCGPDYAFHCGMRQTCYQGRCIPEGYEAAADKVEVDAEKEARLRPLWEEGPCEVIPGRCSNGCGCGAPGNANPGALLLVTLILGTTRLGSRRRT